MSEKAPDLAAEQHEQAAETIVRPEQQPTKHEQGEHHRKAEAARQDKLEKARDTVHEEAGEHEDPLSRLEAASKDADNGSAYGYVDSSTRKDTLNKQLQHLQRKLSTGDRTLSKIVHQPVVRAVSEAAGKTVSRPSGLLGGGLVAFVGSTGYLILAKHLGFTYNSFVFVVLFVAGFLIGLGLELAVWLATASNRREQ